MTKRLILPAALAALAALVLGGCGATKITYTPLAGTPPAASATVALRVIDERPADKGGTTSQVGQVRGSYGIPSAVKDSTTDVTTRTVTEATTDALAQAGVGVGTGGNRVLVARVKHYWMDGFAGYKSTVLVNYSLEDSAGKVLWSAEVSGGAGGALMFKSAESMAQDMFAKALSDLAAKAAEQFKSAQFRQALA